MVGQVAKLPKLKNHQILAVDIGTRFIKVVEMRLNRGVISLLNMATCHTPPDTLDKSQITDPIQLGLAIRQLLLENKITTRKVVLSLRGQSSVVVRPIELPKMSSKELKETMKFEVERHVPFAANEVIMDYAPLADPNDLPEGEENMKVLLAVAQEELVNSYLKVIKTAKLYPVAFDVEILSGIRSLIDIYQSEGSYEQTVAMVNIGASTTDISIIDQGNLVFNRSVPIAGDALTSAIADQMGRSFDEAEEIKIEHGKVFVDPALGALPVPGEESQQSEMGLMEAGGAYAQPEMDATISWGSGGPMPQQIFSLDDALEQTETPAAPFVAQYMEDEPAPPADSTPASDYSPDAPQTTVAPEAETPVFSLDEPDGQPAEATPTAPAPGAFSGPVFDISSEIEGLLPPTRVHVDNVEEEQADDEPADDVIVSAEKPVVPVSGPVQFFDEDADELPPIDSAAVPDATMPIDMSWHEQNEGDSPHDEMFQRRVFEAMVPTLGELATEIQRSLEFHSSREPESVVSRIILYGGSSRLPHLTSFIHQEVGVDVILADPTEALDLSSCLQPEEYLKDLAPALPVCVGLGLRDMLA